MLMGQHALMGVLAGSVTLTGGPATGLAFAPLFEPSVPGAATIAVAAAMVGIVAGGLLGGPLGTFLIERNKLAARKETLAAGDAAAHRGTAANVVEEQMHEPAAQAPAGEDVEAYGLLKALVIILVAMWIGDWVSRWFTSMNITLPAYIGAMLVASVIRNIDDVTGLFGLSQKLIDDIGSVALSLFLVLALMTLRTVEARGPRAAARGDSAGAVAAGGGRRVFLRVQIDGPRLRQRGDVERLRRLHARHDGERDGQHGGDRAEISRVAEGVSGGADGRRVLHRFHERADHHGVPELLPMIS